MTNYQIKLIYILGSGHSGSTLTDLILGSHSSIESVGELFQLPEYVSPDSNRADDRRICTCGVHISKCEYWNNILARIENPLAYEVDSQNNFDDNNYDLIKEILDFTGKTILVDSSKSSYRLKKLIDSQLFDIFVIHLVRDGRAVGYSAKRKQKKLNKKFGYFYKEELNRMNKTSQLYNFYSSVKKWNRDNLKYYKQFSKEPRIRYSILKYEDLVRDTEQKISDILSIFNLEFEDKQLKFYEFSHHNIAGNRMRLAKDKTITLDEEYKKNLSAIEWWWGSWLAYRGLQLFKYPLERNT